MLAWLNDLLRPIRKRDSRFGDLRYFRSGEFWEGKVAFQPTGSVVEVLISGTAMAPTDEQRSFFAEVERRYDELLPAIREILLEARRPTTPDDAQFELICVDIPATPGSHVEWELSYQTRPKSWNFTVTLVGWKPGEVVAEC